MIAVDTSALMAVLLDEKESTACAKALTSNGRIVMSAGTVAETLIVAERRGLGIEMTELLNGLGLEIENVTLAVARRVAGSYARWGKGANPPD